MEDNPTRIDPRSLIPPHLRAGEPPTDEPPTDLREIEEPDPSGFSVSLLALAVVFALVGAARLAWNISEEAHLDYGVFFVLDRSAPYFQLFGLFAIAAAVWRRR
jgi:hypothetical protein